MSNNKKMNQVARPGAAGPAAGGMAATAQMDSRMPAPAARGATMDGTTAIQKVQAPVEVDLSHDAIARAAYLRWQKNGGDSFENWVAAERELRAAAEAARNSMGR